MELKSNIPSEKAAAVRGLAAVGVAAMAIRRIA
jgi:hypothetical protein